MKHEATQGADLILEAFDKKGCDAFNISSYDLAMGKDFLLEKQRKVRFPFVSANLADEKTGQPIFRPYVIKEINGLKVGIFGLVTDRIKVPDLRIEEPIEVATGVVRQLREGCDLIIALTYLEHGKDLKLAQEVEGINFIISGGQHAPFRQMGTTQKKVDHTAIVQAGNRGRYLGRLDITVVDDVCQFVDYSKKSTILSQLESLRDQIELFGQELSSSSDRKRIRKALKTFNKLTKQLKKVEGGSHYINTAIPMNRDIRRDKEIEGMVRQYKANIAEIRKQKSKNMPIQKKTRHERDKEVQDLMD